MWQTGAKLFFPDNGNTLTLRGTYDAVHQARHQVEEVMMTTRARQQQYAQKQATMGSSQPLPSLAPHERSQILADLELDLAGLANMTEIDMDDI
mmetsp:Transcript_32830/g.71620  ORF Transcript_32830/g.71620 Transcript_32830/m.71620 type:complete len:94 (+) Transcript_32830:1-282(+)